MPAKLTLIGPILGTSGYVSHTKNLFKALVESGLDVKLKTSVPPGYEKFLSDIELEAIKKKDGLDRVSISIDLPHSAKFNFPDYNKNIVFVVWEGDKIPKFWIPILLDKRVSQIWTPSKHTKSAIINTLASMRFDEKIEVEDLLVVNKIKIIPHGVDPSVFYETENKIKNNKFTFICNKGWNGSMNDRGGVPYLLKAFLEEFKKEEKVKLIVKVNPAYVNAPLIEKSLEEIKGNKNINEAPETLMNFETLSLTQLNELYNSGDCYIVTQLADSFDLGSAEAMATGMPAIVSGYGGQVEHVTDETGWILKEFTLKEFNADPMYEGISWAEPSIDEIRKIMRYAFEHQDEVKQKGIKAKEFILKEFQWKESAQKAINALKEM